MMFRKCIQASAPAAAVSRIALSVWLGCVMLAAVAPAPAFAQGYQFAFKFGTSGTGPGQFLFPAGIAIDPGLRRLVVSDANNGRVQILSMNGAFLREFGKSGAGDGEFSRPSAVAIDPVSHDIVIADTFNNRVQIFDSEGLFKKSFTLECNSYACFPFHLAIDPRNRNILVVDGQTNQVLVHDSEGKLLDKFGAFGTERRPGFLNNPNGIAIDPASGGIFVCDPNRVLVHYFSAAGVDQIQIRGQNRLPGDIVGTIVPIAAAIDPVSHYIVFTDGVASDGIAFEQVFNRLEVMTAGGDHLGSFGYGGTADGAFDHPGNLAIDPETRNLYVVDEGNTRVQVFAPSGSAASGNAFLSELGSGNLTLDPPFDMSTFNYTAVVAPGIASLMMQAKTAAIGTALTVNGTPLASGGFTLPIVLAPGSNTIAAQTTAANGTVLNYRIVVTRDAEPTPARVHYHYRGQFGVKGSGNGQFSAPAGIAIDPVTRHRIVVDANSHRLQVFDRSGNFVRAFGTEGAADGQLEYPYGVAIDPVIRDLIVTDTGNKRVQVFSFEGVFKRKFGTAGTGDGQFSSPGGVAVDPRNRNIVVVDHVNRRALVFTADGAFVRAIGALAADDSYQPGGASGVAVDPANGNIVLADKFANQVLVYDAEGVLEATIGAIGTAAGRFYHPEGVAIDPVTRNIVVTDTYWHYSAAHFGTQGDANARIQIFTPGGTLAGTFGFPGRGKGQFTHPADIAIDPVDRHLAIADNENYRVQSFGLSGTVVEYYNPDLNNYFITADPAEQAFVDSGAVGRWVRTGETFRAGGPDKVCRFYGNGATNPATGRMFGPNSHFYTVIEAECEGLKAQFTPTAASWNFESYDFATATPHFAANDGTTCPTGLTPVYRLYNDGFARGVDSNHKITDNLISYRSIRGTGWIGEGIVMCAP